jgi:hypothetical protein
MQFASIVVAAGIGIGCCGVADAGKARDDDNWIEAQSLRELPAGVQALLGVGLGPADGGIADREASFNATDVELEDVPSRRFALGIVNGDKAVVALERGGRGYAVQAVEFRQVGTTWEAARCGWLRVLPRRGADLRAAFAAPHPQEGWSCRYHGILPTAAPAAASTITAPVSTLPAAQPKLRQRPGA